MLPVKIRPLTFGEDFDKQVQAYVTELWKAHATVNTAIVISAGEGIAKGICILYLCICGQLKHHLHSYTMNVVVVLRNDNALGFSSCVIILSTATTFNNIRSTVL